MEACDDSRLMLISATSSLMSSLMSPLMVLASTSSDPPASPVPPSPQAARALQALEHSEPIASMCQVFRYQVTLRIGLRRMTGELAGLYTLAETGEAFELNRSQIRLGISQAQDSLTDLRRFGYILERTSLRRIDFNHRPLVNAVGRLDQAVERFKEMDREGFREGKRDEIRGHISAAAEILNSVAPR